MRVLKNRKEWFEYEAGYRYFKQEIKDEPTHYPCVVVSYLYDICNFKYFKHKSIKYVKHIFIYQEDFNNAN